MYVKINDKKIPFIDYTSFFDRFIGLMFKLDHIETGLRFPKCNSIHTMFMCQKIDVIMTDDNDEILYLYPNLKSERIIFPKKNVYYTYELPIGSIQNLKVGDFLHVYHEK